MRDSGIGIPKEALASIFELFRQLGRPLDRSQGGLGIGLTLVKRLVEMHGGAVEVRSEGLATGSEFVVRLPLLVEVSAGAAPELHVADAAAPRPRAGGGVFSSPTTTSISRRAWDCCSS